MVVVEEEIKKIEVKISKAQKSRDSLLAKINIKDYNSRVPEDVRLSNEQKVILAVLMNISYWL